MADNSASSGSLLAGRTMVIAGVGPGLGGQIARSAVRHGAAVVMGARSADYGTALATEFGAAGAAAIFQPCDVTIDADCDALIEAGTDAFGGVDCVVANAMSGAGSGQTLEEADFDQWSEAFQVNLFGSLRVVRSAIPALEQSGNGSVVFIGSQIVRRVFPGRGAYAASKAALLTAAQVLAAELGPEGVRVNTVVPGRMWGPPLQSAVPRLAAERGTTEDEQVAGWIDATALKRLATDEECSRAVVFLASDLAAAITGQSIDANAGETMR
jgi:NAD(P)-dependent dehydrogenase (short-subunit alcohol dehydrogenase family)